MNDPRWLELTRRVQEHRIDRRRLVQTAAAAGLAAPMASLPMAARPASAQIDNSTLVIAQDLKSDWITLDPGHIYEVTPSSASNLNYECLYYLPDPSKPTDFTLMLAADMPSISDDGITATIKLRDDIKFHSGNPMTADDVVFSWTRLKNLKGNPSFFGTDYWDSVTAVDPHTIEIKLKAPNVTLVPILASQPLAITDSKLLKEHGGTDAEDADQTDTAQDWINAGNSVGTGPYKLTAWDIEGEVVLEKAPDYWGEPAKLDRIIYRAIVDPNSQLQAIQAGEADIAGAVDPDAVESVKADSSLQLITGPTLNHQYLALHTQPDPGGPLANKAVRQAIGYAIDYDGILNDLLLGGASQPATIAPEPLQGTEEVRPLKYKLDLAKAQELFDSAKVAPAEITLTYGAGTSGEAGLDLETMCSKLQSDLQKINGLTVKLNPMDSATRLADFRASKLQFTTSSWSPDYVDIATYADPFGRTGGAAAKRVGFSNANVDKWLDEGIQESDPEKREAIYVNILKTIIDEAGFLVLYQPDFKFPASAAVKGVSTHPIYLLQLRNASKE